MSIKRSADGVQPPYLDKTGKPMKYPPIPFPSTYGAVYAGSPGPAKGGEEVAKGPSYSTAKFDRRK